MVGCRVVRCWCLGGSVLRIDINEGRSGGGRGLCKMYTGTFTMVFMV